MKTLGHLRHGPDDRPPLICPSCYKPLSDGQAECTHCGSAAEQKPATPEFAAHIVAEQSPEKLAMKAARWLLVLAGMFVVGGTIFGFQAKSEADEVRPMLELMEADEMVELDDGTTLSVGDILSELDTAVVTSFALLYGLAIAFVALFFWARKEPFKAMVGGLGLYVAVLVFDAVDDPSTLLKGMFWKAIVIGGLLKGIQQGRIARDQIAALPTAKLGSE